MLNHNHIFNVHVDIINNLKGIVLLLHAITLHRICTVYNIKKTCKHLAFTLKCYR